MCSTIGTQRQAVRLTDELSAIFDPVSNEWKKVSSKEPEISLPVVVKADNIGRLETLLMLLEQLANENSVFVRCYRRAISSDPVQVKVVSCGVGDVNETDLVHAQIEVEELHHPFVPIYCFGSHIGLDHNAHKWLAKNLELQPKLHVKELAVIYDVIRDVKECFARTLEQQKAVQEELRLKQRQKKQRRRTPHRR